MSDNQTTEQLQRDFARAMSVQDEPRRTGDELCMDDKPKPQPTVQKLKEEGRLKPFPEDLRKRHEERLRQSETTPNDELALDMLCAMRPSVSRWVFADFMAGRSPRTPYLHVDPAEFRRIIGWIRERGGRPLDRLLPAPEPEYDDDMPF